MTLEDRLGETSGERDSRSKNAGTCCDWLGLRSRSLLGLENRLLPRGDELELVSLLPLVGPIPVYTS